jgi:hypothetical protein
MGQESDVDNTSAVTATSKNGANAIIANSDRGRALRVTSDTNTGVESTGHIGVDAQTVRLCASEPMTQPRDLELRRWHGTFVAGIMLAGSAAFALVFWVTVWGTFR